MIHTEVQINDRRKMAMKRRSARTDRAQFLGIRRTCQVSLILKSVSIDAFKGNALIQPCNISKTCIGDSDKPRTQLQFPP